MENGKQGAFACTDGKTFANDGLTKREYFAGLAMQGLMACSEITASRKEIAEESVKMADELLKALDNGTEKNI